jgi:hypothetical protein
MGKQISKNLLRILTVFIVATLIVSVGAAFEEQQAPDPGSNDGIVKVDNDIGNQDWWHILEKIHPMEIGNISAENKTHDRDDNGGHDNGGPGYGGPGYGGALVPMPMYGSPMYGSEPSMFGSESSTTAVPNSEPNICKGKVSSSKCHNGKCALSKHKHKHKNYSKKHKAEKNC